MLGSCLKRRNPVATTIVTATIRCVQGTCTSSVVATRRPTRYYFGVACCNKNHHNSITNNNIRRSSTTSSTVISSNPWNDRNDSYLPRQTKKQQRSNTTTKQTYTRFSTSFTRGYDISSDLLDDKVGAIPKIVITGYSASGFDVLNVIKRVDNKDTNASTASSSTTTTNETPTNNNNNNSETSAENKDNNKSSNDGLIHMNGSILAFPHGCFLWNVTQPNDITFESLAPILFYRPKLSYLFIGYNRNAATTANTILPRNELLRIQKSFQAYNSYQSNSIVIEEMSLNNAIGTFNLLNAEDRQVAVALIMDTSEEEED